LLNLTFSRDASKLTGVLLLLGEQALDLVTDLTFGHLDIVLGLAVLAHEGEEAIVGDVELYIRCQYHIPRTLTREIRGGLRAGTRGG